MQNKESQEWLDLRENMITASDIASAIGENHYESVDAFIKKKVLRTKWAGNAATAHGTLLEPMVRDLYDQTTGRKTHEIGLVQHRDYPWLGASPDGVTEDGLLVEIKCPLTRKIEAKVPKYYWPQVQLQLEITDLEECDFVQYRPARTENGVSLTEFVIVRVKRDREWFRKNLPLMKETWNRVLKARMEGLCEVRNEEAVPPHKEEIFCTIREDGDRQGSWVQTQKPFSQVQGLHNGVLRRMYSI
jgi:putative phage-type endonuclease